METIKQIMAVHRDEAANTNASNETPRLLTHSSSVANKSTREQFCKAIAALVAWKRTTDLSTVQLEAWYAALGHFPADVLNRAIIEIAISVTPFPDMGNIYQICRRSLPQPYCPNGSSTDRPSKAEIAAIAERIGLEV